MREIKFRAWDKKNLCFLQQPLALLDFENNCICNYEIVQVDDNEWEQVQNICYDYILTQSVNLFDKNGIEIYDGDIVKCELKTETDNNNIIIGEITEEHYIWVVNTSTIYCYTLEQLLSKDTSFEVIGNIYENKELLNV